MWLATFSIGIHQNIAINKIAFLQQLLVERLVLYVSEISKTVDMYMFLFDDILLLTRIKKAPRKVFR